MAFALYTSVGSTTTQLNDGSPFWLASAEGLSGSGIVRQGQSGPLQQGESNLGYTLAPRMITLNLHFYASSASTLDTYRDALIEAFAPHDSIYTYLSVQRDDNEIRTLVCQIVDEIKIELVPEEKAARLHRAVVSLRAASPLWKANSVTSGSASFSEMGSWWLAGGAITSGSVRNHWEYVGQTKVTAFAGTITDNWAVAVVTAKDTAGMGTEAYLFQDAGSADFGRRIGGAGDRYGFFSVVGTTSWPSNTGYNYHVIESRSGTPFWKYWNGTSLITQVQGFTDVSLIGANFAWRRNNLATDYFWTPEVRKAAIIQNSTTAQLETLAPYMLDTLQGSITLVNDGDVPAYPVITLRGPLADPVIVNTTTNGTLSLAGGTLSAADTWTLDLRDGHKRLYDQNGTNVLGSVSTTPIAMADFYLAPAPIAAGGTNVLVMTPGSVGSAALFAAEITNRYLSF